MRPDWHPVVVTRGIAEADAQRVNRSRALDGLRGFAALAVVTCHLTAHLGLAPYATGGNIGVLVFFVLSGYLIGGQCWDHALAPHAWMTFIRRRVVRLAPAVLGLAVVGAPLLVAWGGETVAVAARNAFFAVTQTMGFAWVAGAVGPDGVPAWSPTWSLTVEWVFYLTTPLILILARRRAIGLRTARNAAFGGALLLYAVALPLPAVAFYLLPVANLGVMWLGAGLALSHRLEPTRTLDPAWSMFGAAVLLSLTVLPGTTLGWSYRAMILPVSALSSALVIDGCRRGAPICRILARFGLPAVGLRAYSLYLWHLPVLWLLWFKLPHGHEWLVAWAFAALLPVVVAASFNYLEAPWLRTGRAARTSRRSWRRQNGVARAIDIR